MNGKVVHGQGAAGAANWGCTEACCAVKQLSRACAWHHQNKTHISLYSLPLYGCSWSYGTSSLQRLQERESHQMCTALADIINLGDIYRALADGLAQASLVKHGMAEVCGCRWYMMNNGGSGRTCDLTVMCIIYMHTHIVGLKTMGRHFSRGIHTFTCVCVYIFIYISNPILMLSMWDARKKISLTA